MDSTKAAIQNIFSKAGHHDTTVDESVKPAVTEETLNPTRHEAITQAIDREVHQHHHHTTVQPLQHQEVLPEKHSHQQVPIEEREFRHGNESETKERLAMEAEKYKNTTTTDATRMTESTAPTVSGEHVHHHVHETVQPVLHKEKIIPEVIHTVVPIHERHTAPSEHHGLSTLPVRTLDEFKAAGGSITGGTQARHEKYEGHPRSYNSEMQVDREPADLEPAKHDGMHDLASTGHLSGGSGTNTALHSSSLAKDADPSIINDRDAGRTVGGNGGVQVGALAGADAIGAGATGHKASRSGGTITGGSGIKDCERTVNRTTGAQTGALGGAETAHQLGNDPTHSGAPASGTTVGAVERGIIDGSNTGTGGLADESTQVPVHTSGTATSGIGSGTQAASHISESTTADPTTSASTGAITGTGSNNSTTNPAHDVREKNPDGSNEFPRKYNGVGTGVAGVGAGVAASDLSRNHSTADQPSDANLNDETMTTDASGTGLTRATLREKTEGNTNTKDFNSQVDPRTDSVGHPAADTGVDEPQTTTAQSNSVRDQPRTSNMADQENTEDTRDTVQQGGAQQDAATEGEDILHGEHPKMTGTGEPGSHSAFFGLTPDGKVDENTKSTTTAPKPAHSKKTSNTAAGGGTESTEDTGSRGASGEKVADQMDDPRAAEGAHGRDSEQANIGSGDKAGSGTAMNPEQGSGKVKPAEEGTGAERATMKERADPNIDADGDGKAGVLD